jgi:hypothetical protein
MCRSAQVSTRRRISGARAARECVSFAGYVQEKARLHVDTMPPGPDNAGDARKIVQYSNFIASDDKRYINPNSGNGAWL